jgi:hypothetical protein
LNIAQTPVLLALILLTGSLCLGLGLLVQKQNVQPKDPLWIEQLPSSELPGSVSSSTKMVPESVPAPAASQSDDPESTSVPVSQPAAAAAALSTPQSGNYVAAKTGTKYYLPTCATAKRIKDTNKVWFATKAQAEAAGYQAASNCKGL